MKYARLREGERIPPELMLEREFIVSRINANLCHLYERITDETFRDKILAPHDFQYHEYDCHTWKVTPIIDCIMNVPWFTDVPVIQG